MNSSNGECLARNLQKHPSTPSLSPDTTICLNFKFKCKIDKSQNITLNVNENYQSLIIYLFFLSGFYLFSLVNLNVK
ncbi:hypothetical protein HanIR_Chr13g0663511 [Helianthus annuus]|nr:hypothetical protein HanIR_Chr13g0663511 [Helianthus annuus]